MALYLDEGQLVLHLVVNGDDISRKIGYLATGEWYEVFADFSQNGYKITSKCSVFVCFLVLTIFNEGFI